MEFTTLGRTGIKVSRLGVGLAEIGQELSFREEAEAGRVLSIALDGGISFLDTAACYGISEELIGRTIAHRRADYILATKCGHVIEGDTGEEWTAQTVRDSIERSLVRMKTDYMDIVQLHSCGLSVLEKGEVIEALMDAQRAGKTRFVGYSEPNRGDKDAARWSLESGLFDTLQTSFNLVDQHTRTQLFQLAEDQDVGLIIKRPIANGVWGMERSPSAYADEYFRRARIMADMGPIRGAPEDGITLALGFVLAYPEVDTAIVGTRNPVHAQADIQKMAEALLISVDVVTELERRFAAIEGQLGPI